jgi:hypothetical protein
MGSGTWVIGIPYELDLERKKYWGLLWALPSLAATYNKDTPDVSSGSATQFDPAGDRIN